ncbi:MAG: RecX family transcriptional regulator [Alphaproteobacteria bacterium]|nr:RecX family transcriptional regulator [Alphaproteobacteria bacterium]
MTDTRQTRKRRTPRPATQERLRKAALHYIDRYATSAGNLHDVLMRRVARSARLHGTDPRQGRQWAEDIVAEFVDRGLVDDRSYAETRAVSLHRGGASRRKIAMALKSKGVGSADVDAALAALEEGHRNSELAAARNYARRRRFGPWRAADERDARRERDLAAMARAGFSYATALKVIDAPDIDALERDVAGGPD